MRRLLAIFALLPALALAGTPLALKYDSQTGATTDIPSSLTKINFPAGFQLQIAGVPIGGGTPLSVFGTSTVRGIQKEIWISLRTDGKGVVSDTAAGTADNPFDGSGTKFDALMASFATAGTANITFHLSSGTFTTNVATAGLGSAFYVKPGWNINGSGRDVTIIQLTGDLSGQHHGVAAFQSVNTVSTDNVTIRDLTVDCNYAGLIADTGSGSEKNFKSGAIFIYGSNNVVENVRVTNSYGSFANEQEQFAIGLSGPIGIASSGNEIRDCRVDTPHGNYGAPFSIFGVSGFPTQNAKVSGCYACGINNGLNGGFPTGGVNIAYVKDLTVESNTFVDTHGPVYWDTGTVDGLYIRNNQVTRGFQGGVELVASGATPTNVEITGNSIQMQNRVAAGRTYGIFGFSELASITNLKIEGNTLYYLNTGSGMDEFASIGAANVIGCRAVNNVSDDATFGVAGVTGTGLTILGNRTHAGVGLTNLADQASVNSVDALAVGALRFTATTTTTAGAISFQMLGSRTITSGDHFVYEVLLDSNNPSFASTVFLADSGSSNIGQLADQNGINTIDDIGVFAKEKWYLRTCDLTAYAGSTVAKVIFGLIPLQSLGQQNPVGTYLYYLRNLKIVNSSGVTVAQFYTNETKTSATELSSAHVTGELATPNFSLGTLSTVIPGTGVATFLTTPSSANLATAVTDETGSGALVFANSPTFVTPALGTPSSGVATNLTGTATGLTSGNATKWTTGRTIALTGDVTYTSGSLDGSGNVTGASTLANIPAISGVNLTNLNATNLGSGTVPTARLGSGTANSTTVLYGDQSYKSISSSLAIGSTTIASGSGSTKLLYDNSGTLGETAAPTFTDLVLNGSAGGNAASGAVGEYASSSVIQGSATALTTATPKTVTSVSLTAGDWDVTGIGSLTGASTGTEFDVAIGTTTNSFTGTVLGDTRCQTPTVSLTGADATLMIPAVRVSISSPTTYYLIVQETFTIGSPSAYGRISARRVR